MTNWDDGLDWDKINEAVIGASVSCGFFVSVKAINYMKSVVKMSLEHLASAKIDDIDLVSTHYNSNNKEFHVNALVTLSYCGEESTVGVDPLQDIIDMYVGLDIDGDFEDTSYTSINNYIKEVCESIPTLLNKSILGKLHEIKVTQEEFMAKDDTKNLILTKEAEFFHSVKLGHVNNIKATIANSNGLVSLQEVMDIWNEINIKGVLES